MPIYHNPIVFSTCSKIYESQTLRFERSIAVHQPNITYYYSLTSAYFLHNPTAMNLTTCTRPALFPCTYCVGPFLQQLMFFQHQQNLVDHLSALVHPCESRVYAQLHFSAPEIVSHVLISKKWDPIEGDNPLLERMSVPQLRFILCGISR